MPTSLALEIAVDLMQIIWIFLPIALLLHIFRELIVK